MRTITAVSLAALALAGAGCSASITATPSASPSPTVSRQDVNTDSPVPATPTDTDNPSGALGDSFTISGQGSSYSVRLVKVLQHAAPSDEFEAPGAGKHLAGAELVIKGISGHESDDADNDLTAQGSDGQTYQPSFNSIAAGTNFDSGQFRVSAGVHARGWVSFELPSGVRIAALMWVPESGLNDSVATWQL
jgi:hypothetical protein